MYLSRLDLQITSPAIRQALRDCQDMHRTLMKAFDCSREQSCLLFRVIRTDQRISIYAQSLAVPQWKRIENNGFSCVKMQDISALLDCFQEDGVLRFSLLAYPTKKIKGDGKNSRRVLLRGEECLAWLKRQGEKNGFLILEAHEEAKEQVLSGVKASGAFKLSGVPFEGVLKITNTEAFRRGFQQGIGPEKAYGFGLLMVSRA